MKCFEAVSFYLCTLPVELIPIWISSSDTIHGDSSCFAEGIDRQIAIVWDHISWKCISCTYFVTCQNCLDLSGQNVKYDNSSVHAQQLYVPCDSSWCQIQFIDDERVWYWLAWYCHVKMQNLHVIRNVLIKFQSVMSYQSWKGRSLQNRNLYHWWMSSCIHPCTQLRNCMHRLSAYYRAIDYCVR